MNIENGNIILDSGVKISANEAVQIYNLIAPMIKKGDMEIAYKNIRGTEPSEDKLEGMTKCLMTQLSWGNPLYNSLCNSIVIDYEGEKTKTTEKYISVSIGKESIDGLEDFVISGDEGNILIIEYGEHKFVDGQNEPFHYEIAIDTENSVIRSSSRAYEKKDFVTGAAYKSLANFSPAQVDIIIKAAEYYIENSSKNAVQQSYVLESEEHDDR